MNSSSGSRAPLTKFLSFTPKFSNQNDDTIGWRALATLDINRNQFLLSN